MEPAAISPALQNRPPRGKARAHSLFVRFLRIALPIVMIAVVATLAGLVIDHALKRRAAARKAKKCIECAIAPRAAHALRCEACLEANRTRSDREAATA